MKPIYFIIICLGLIFAQDEIENVESSPAEVIADTLSSPEPVPQGLEFGYKGLGWGSPMNASITNPFLPIINEDSTSYKQSFVGSLGPDSVNLTYFFADSGFWKVEIDFILKSYSFEKQIADFRRLEKNVSSVYGPAQRINQKESGATGAYTNILDQKFANAFYRSSWTVTPVIIELLLNTSVLLPKTDLPIFSGNFAVLKLVYYNPDFMHSSQPMPEPEKIPSIFDIY